MAVLSWDKPLERLFEAGVDRGVLYPRSTPGVAWNGLTSVNETSRGGEVVGYYQDGVRRYQRARTTEFGATLSALMYPDEFMPSDGIYSNGRGLQIDGQAQAEFGLAYRTLVGDGVQGTRKGYKLHMIYNAMAQPSARSYTTAGQSETLTTFSWDLHTRPLAIEGYRASAHIVIDSTKAPADVVVPLERILYGTSGTSPRLPFPAEILELFTGLPAQTLTITTGSNGQFTASGGDFTVTSIDDDTFQLDSPGVVFHEDGTFTASDF